MQFLEGFLVANVERKNLHVVKKQRNIKQLIFVLTRATCYRCLSMGHFT